MPGQQFVAGLLAQLGVAHHDRNDVTVAGENRDSCLTEQAFQPCCLVEQPFAFGGGVFEVVDGGKGPGGDGRWQRGGENEAGGETAHEIHEIARGRDIAADGAEGLGQRSLNDVHLFHDALALGHAAAAVPVHAHGVNLVEEGKGVIALGQLHNFRNGAEIAIHGIDGFENDDLGTFLVLLFQQFLEMGQIVMAENLLLRFGKADALDHGGMVHLVGEQQAVGQP